MLFGSAPKKARIEPPASSTSMGTSHEKPRNRAPGTGGRAPGCTTTRTISSSLVTSGSHDTSMVYPNWRPASAMIRWLASACAFWQDAR